MTHEPGEDEAAGRSDELSPKTLGQQLREARDKKQISLEKISEELRIDLSVLQALEGDRLDELAAAPVFVKGYIKQYGRQLGLDYVPLYDAYQRQVSRDDIELRPNRAIALRDERQITVWIVAALVLALILVFLFVWWLGDRDAIPVLGTSTAPPVTPAARTTPLVTQPRAEAVPVDVPAAVTPAPAEVGASAATGAATPDQAVATEAPPTQATTAAAEVTIPVVPAPRAEGSIALTMTFTTESWVEVTDARGEQLMYDLAAPGSTVELYPVPPARVLLGNAEGVQVTVDGRAFAVPNQGRRGNLANFVIRSQD